MPRPEPQPGPPARAYVGLGSNLDGPAEQVCRALEALAGLPATTLVARSSLYASTPLLDMPQPDYVNAVAGLDTGLAPRALLQALLAIETRQWRVRGAERWGPRTLDLDLLLYGDRTLDQPDLRVPHPRLGEREFVLVPLAEIAPALRVPGLGAVAELAARIPRRGLRALED